MVNKRRETVKVAKRFRAETLHANEASFPAAGSKKYIESPLGRRHSARGDDDPTKDQ